MKALKITLGIISGAVVVLGIVTAICLIHYIGISKCVGEKEYSYSIEEKHVVFDEYDFYGKTLIPAGDKETYPTVIYVHGADSYHDADMTTLKSLAKSGIASYTFDIYGWSTLSKGPDGKGDYFKGTERGVDDAYEKQVIKQAYYLDEIIAKVKDFDFVDKDNLYLLGSSMGGATVCASMIKHSQDIKSVILQYPAINLVVNATKEGDPSDVNQYQNQVLILQGKKDVIVPYTLSQELCDYLNKSKEDHAQIVYYENQGHVFDGTYKVEAAKEIYRFITK